MHVTAHFGIRGTNSGDRQRNSRTAASASDSALVSSGIAGAEAGATGWWSNLRVFSLDRFMPAGGGRLPIQRYLSKLLLNRITVFELDQIRGDHPDVLNGLPSDELYPEVNGSQPERANAAYDEVESSIRLDSKSNREHLPAISEGLRIFAELAELESATLDTD